MASENVFLPLHLETNLHSRSNDEASCPQYEHATRKVLRERPCGRGSQRPVLVLVFCSYCAWVGELVSALTSTLWIRRLLLLLRPQDTTGAAGKC